MWATLLLLAAASTASADAACAEPVMAGVSGVSFPTPAKKSPPEYPEDARASHLGGRVLLMAIVCPDGVVRDVQVLTGVPWARSLEGSAARAVRTWRYAPALKDGRAVPVYLTVSVDFDADGGGLGWPRSTVKLKAENTTLDRALAKLQAVGLEIEYAGSTPPIHDRFDGLEVQTILDALARRYALRMELVSAHKLRVTALPGPDTPGVEAPVLESRVEPDLPDGLHGNVGLNLVVLADGTVETATVVRPSGDQDFDGAAAKAAKAWRYRPAMSKGRAVAAYVPVHLER